MYLGSEGSSNVLEAVALHIESVGGKESDSTNKNLRRQPENGGAQDRGLSLCSPHSYRWSQTEEARLRDCASHIGQDLGLMSLEAAAEDQR